MELTNKELKRIHKEYHDMGNKELSDTLVALKNDFEKVKIYLLSLTNDMDEFAYVYDEIYGELQERLGFEDTEKK